MGEHALTPWHPNARWRLGRFEPMRSNKAAAPSGAAAREPPPDCRSPSWFARRSDERARSKATSDQQDFALARGPDIVVILEVRLCDLVCLELFPQRLARDPEQSRRLELDPVGRVQRQDQALPLELLHRL